MRVNPLTLFEELAGIRTYLVEITLGKEEGDTRY